VTFCFAVGQVVSRTERSVVERWDGQRWTQLGSNAFPTYPENWLNSVSCTSPSFCMAAGARLDTQGDADDAFVARWDGHHWTMSADANPNNELNWLHGVSCASPSRCATVGEVNNNYPTLSLVGSWDGTSWTINQQPSADNDALFGVSCPRTNSCIAVGARNAGPFAERWNNTGWHQTPAPSAALSSVWCMSPTSCFAGGDHAIVHWNGTRWSVSLQSKTDHIDGVTCTGSTCFAVGSSDSPGAPPLILRHT
jgi:hypothetical protein